MTRLHVTIAALLQQQCLHAVAMMPVILVSEWTLFQPADAAVTSIHAVDQQAYNNARHLYKTLTLLWVHAS